MFALDGTAVKISVLQRCMVLGLLALSAAWVIKALADGQPAFAVAGAALVLGGHATVIAVEFTILGWIEPGDGIPPATPGQRFRAWWSEVVHASLVFGWRQPFRSNRSPDNVDAARHAGRRGVVLVHGFLCNRGLWQRWLDRLTIADVPFMAVSLEPVFGSIDDYGPLVEAAVAELESCTGQPPILVAHSMGGLAVRHWWSRPGRLARAHHVITIGTPQRGTWLARWAFATNARQMRLDSAWCRALAASEAGDAAQRAARMTCFYSHCDNVVLPAASATIQGADNRHLPGVAHVQMVDEPQPWHALERLLRASG